MCVSFLFLVLYGNSMALGIHGQPFIAKNVIVGLDFDGTIAYGAHVRVWYAKKFYGASLTAQQILGETWPKELGKDRYRQMADAADGEYMGLQQLAPGCKDVLSELYTQGFRFAVVTSRARKLIGPAEAFIRHHGLPISYFHATDHTPKDYLCSKLHARAFFDDGLYNLKPLTETFVKPFFLRQPWNGHEPTPPGSSGIATVASWQEFGRQLLLLKEMHEAICRFNKWENAYYNIARIAAFWKSHPDKCSAYLHEYKKSTVGALA